MSVIVSSDFDLDFRASIDVPFELKMAHWDKAGLIPRRRTERKGWVYAATFNEDFFAAMAVVDAGYGGTAFCYLFDRHSQRLIEEKISVPLAFDDKFEAKLDSVWQIGDKKRTWQIEPTEGGLLCTFQSDNFSVSMNLQIQKQGLNALCPSKGRPFNYTYKNILLPVEVKANVEGVSYHCKDNSGSIDYSLGYPPRETRWNWASMIGTTSENQPFGLNLVAHHNDSLENGIWLHSEIHKVGATDFQYKKPMEKNTTRIKVPDFDLSLTFEPEGCRKENVNYLAISSDFVQPFGKFTGTLLKDGKKITVNGLGVVEDHFARW